MATGVLANYTGDLHESDANAIRSRLFFQLFHPVRWRACMEAALETGVDTIVEIGGGIGRGEGPEGKRPNLESVVKKTLRAHDSRSRVFRRDQRSGYWRGRPRTGTRRGVVRRGTREAPRFTLEFASGHYMNISRSRWLQ